jgi:Amt family ammonium transporter
VGLKDRLGYDDSLDVVGVHLVGGVLGVLLTGVFASLVINPAGAAASFAQLGKQAVLAGVTVAFSFAATMLILKVTDSTVGLRVTGEHEEVGLDSSQHGEVGYRF